MTREELMKLKKEELVKMVIELQEKVAKDYKQSEVKWERIKSNGLNFRTGSGKAFNFIKGVIKRTARWNADAKCWVFRTEKDREDAIAEVERLRTEYAEKRKNGQIEQDEFKLQ